MERWSCPQLSDEAALLTSELVTNAVVHAGSEVDLHLTRTPWGVKIEVADEAAGEVEPEPTQPLSTTGRGLLLVEAIAREWGVRPAPGGKAVWFEL